MKKKKQASESSSDCNSSSTSSPAVSSIEEEPSTLQQFITETNPGYEGPSYNIDVSPVATSHVQLPDSDQYQPQIFPTYQNIRYHNEMDGYPTEYYPPTYEYGEYGFSENAFQPFQTTHATQWYGHFNHDVNGYTNNDFLWQ